MKRTIIMTIMYWLKPPIIFTVSFFGLNLQTYRYFISFHQLLQISFYCRNWIELVETCSINSSAPSLTLNRCLGIIHKRHCLYFQDLSLHILDSDINCSTIVSSTRPLPPLKMRRHLWMLPKWSFYQEARVTQIFQPTVRICAYTASNAVSIWTRRIFVRQGVSI